VTLRRLVLIGVIVSLSACANLSNLNFRIDHRLHWQGPRERALVQTPLTLTWSFDRLPPGSTFAVFVDRAPVKPGQTLKAVASGDRACKSDPTCPNAEYLAERRVYATTGMTLSLDLVAPLAGNRDHVQLHQATIVLLDAAGRRVGESAWTRQFKVRRVSLV
jgi:hypothetical protein